MMTNLIKITDIAPVYPVEHVAEMLSRAQEVLPTLNEDQAQRVVCDLFGVSAIEKLVDKEGIIEEYEYQPALTYDDMSEMVTRITPWLEARDKSASRFQATWVIRNILNCVPASLEDLADYLTEDTLASINFTFNVGSGDLGEIDTTLHTEEYFKDKDADIKGMIAMSKLNSDSIDDLDRGLTSRQRLLTRGAEYFVLHRYGYTVASLWMAKFLSPSNHCLCSKPDCPGRHFGFMDIEASRNLILENLEYITELPQQNAIPVSEETTMDDIVEDDAELPLLALESHLVIDQKRKHPEIAGALIDAAFEMKAYLGSLDVVRLIALTETSVELYGSDVFRGMKHLTPETFDGMEFEAIDMMQKIASSIEETPDSKHLPLFDAHNFLASGIRIKDTDFGLFLRAAFLKSIYDAQSYVEFATELKKFCPLSPTLDESTQSLFSGFFENFSTRITALRSKACPSHMNALYEAAQTDKIIKILSELGHVRPMKKRLEKAETRNEQEYWGERIAVAEWA